MAEEDVRHRAAGILSLHKLRMLEAADIAVVDKQRLDALEQLEKAARFWRNCFVDRAGFSVNSAEGLANHFRNGDSTWALARAVEALEAMEDESNTATRP